MSACLFHWTRAIDVKLSESGLSNLRKKSPQFAHAQRLIRALAFVPAEDIPNVYPLIVAYLGSHMQVK
jgi:hypothetical protein